MTLGSNSIVGQVVLGKYLILGELFEASLGSVYFGRDDGGNGEPVLIKAISPLHLKSVDATDLFESEFKQLQGIKSPGISAVLDLGTDLGSYMVVTEYVEGYDLRHWFAVSTKKRGELPVSVAVRIARQVLEALAELHEPSGDNPSIIHRDLKPSNIIIDREGNTTLTDFGLSRIVSKGTAVFDPTASDKLGYLTPELVMNSDPGPPSDIYGVGLVLYELLVGDNPFAVGNMALTLSAIMKDKPPAASSKRTDLPAGLSDAIAKALEKKPEDRFASAADFIAALDACVKDDGASRIVELIKEDFDDPLMLEHKQVVSLAERRRLIDEVEPTAQAAPWVPPVRKKTEQQERETTTTSGEVVVKRTKRESQAAVWREISPPAKKLRTGPPPALIIAGLVVLALVVVVLLLLR